MSDGKKIVRVANNALLEIVLNTGGRKVSEGVVEVTQERAEKMIREGQAKAIRRLEG